MAESYQIFTGLSGASSVTFNKHFISGDHLSVEDDGVVLASSAYTVVPTGSYPYSAATINFAPAVSGTIKVVRNTPVPAGALNKDFSDGSVLKAVDLDDMQRYHGFRAQEDAEQGYKPIATDAVGLTVQGLGSQTGDLLQLLNNTGTVLAKFDSTGNGYFGSNTLCIRQIVAADFSGTAETSITDSSDYRKTGIEFNITPKLSTSHLLFLWSTRVTATDDAGSGTNVGWSQTLYKDPNSVSEGAVLAGGTPLPTNAQQYAFTGASANPVKYNHSGPFMFMHAPGSTSAAKYVYGVKVFSSGDDVSVRNTTAYGWGYAIEIG